MEEKWMHEYEQSLLKLFAGGEYETVGYIGYAAARTIATSVVELSWYPNTYTRFHELRITLPRDQFVTCVGCWRFDEKPRIFVTSAWLNNLYLRSYSVFAMIDAADVKDALQNGTLTRDKLVLLRNRIDQLAANYRAISFISFADSLLLKSNWSVGAFDSAIKYTYNPEIFILLISEIQKIYGEVLGLRVYAILTQGVNEYYNDELLHTSATGNHICLNSLGLPFSQLKSIEAAARKAIKQSVHARSELYMDENFFRSLSLSYEFKKESCGRNSYQEPMTGADSHYRFAECRTILENLRKIDDDMPR